MTPKRTVPFADLKAQHELLADELQPQFKAVIESSAFIRGPFVSAFEAKFASLTESNCCISCANGTDSLFIAMKSLDVGPGDEVIVPAHTWISTSETVSLTGGSVVFADIDADTYTICPDSIAAKITPRTVGIIPVHLYGHPANMTDIVNLASKHNIWVIEDCAQAHLASFDGKQVGSFGVAASYSFYPGKNLGAMGDAGAITTADEELARKMMMFARHGGINKGEHYIEGINSRMDGLQAAVLLVKLPYLQKWTQRRQELASRYISAFKDVGAIKIPIIAPLSSHVWHLFVIQSSSRDLLKEYLLDCGISTSVNYPVSLPFLPAYSSLLHTHQDFPNAYALQTNGLALPLYPELTDELQDYVISCILSYFTNI